MTKLKKAISQSIEEWSDKIENSATNVTEEEIEESADRVWERIKKEMGVN